MAIALVTGMLGARAAATLLPAAAAARAASLLAGALGGVIAAALIATVAVAGHAVPLPPTAQSGGIDLAAILGNAASGAIGGIVLSMLAGALFRAVRRR